MNNKRVVLYVIKKIRYFEPRLNDKYVKIFTMVGLTWGVLFFFIQGVAAEVVTNMLVTHNESVEMLGFEFMEPFIFGVGFFVFYSVLGGALFILMGEVFIRVCDLFKINSKLYFYMVKTKDISQMKNHEYHSKYDSNGNIIKN